MSGFESDIGRTVAPLVIGTLITWLKPIYAKMARIWIDWKFSEILFEAMLKAWIWCNSWPNEVKKYKMICGCCLRFWKTSPGHMSGYWILISNSETPPLQLGQNWFHKYCSVQSVCDRIGGQMSTGQGVIFHLYSIYCCLFSRLCWNGWDKAPSLTLWSPDLWVRYVFGGQFSRFWLKNPPNSCWMHGKKYFKCW